MLAWTIYISFAGALATRLSPSKSLARWIALLTALIGLGIGLSQRGIPGSRANC